MFIPLKSIKLFTEFYKMKNKCASYKKNATWQELLARTRWVCYAVGDSESTVSLRLRAAACFCDGTRFI